LNTTVCAAVPETPADPKVQPLITKFISLLEKAYLVQSEEQFAMFFEGFFEEVDSYLDDLRLGGKALIDPKQEAEFSNDEIRDLEEFMNKYSKKERKK